MHNKITLFLAKNEPLFHLSRFVSFHWILKFPSVLLSILWFSFNILYNKHFSWIDVDLKKQKTDLVLPRLLQTALISLSDHLLVFRFLKKKKQMVTFINHENLRTQQDETAIINRYLSVLLHTLSSFYKGRQDNQLMSWQTRFS